ncbi:hypothetical protein TSACC_21674 [Terrimicrobium sacchariphilum]|uniref:Uncharacterized protein n=1 Tax=Terrimicrobium sacchariphilum TaxID=690879 RepID=A0A146G6Y1_TERSA|nr:hypothetical protein [Terrimicrobium sacchariphilum]GAT33261.1 hypothetical protein TSACC_21674 [Terrimicrobium sacchariphilum]
MKELLIQIAWAFVTVWAISAMGIMLFSFWLTVEEIKRRIEVRFGKEDER